MTPDRLTWRGIIAAYLAVAVVPVSLWIASNPVAGTLGIAAAVGSVLAARRAADLVRCLRQCRECTVHLGESVRITVTRPPADDVC